MTTLRRRLLTLSLIAAAGTAVLSGCAASASSAFEGIWGDTAETSAPSLVLESDGSVSGTDGCNRLVGGWSEADGTASFEALASTKMACEGVDTWLSGAVTATVDGDELVLSDGSGAEIGTLTRG